MITESFSFNLEKDINIGETSKILKEYHSKFAEAFSLKMPLPIFLDTNILLNYYGMSTKDKDALKAFFVEKNELIHITEQIEREFQRNRISTIQDYFEELKKIKKDFRSDLQEGVKNKFNNILQSKIVEKDFPDILQAVKSVYDELEKKLFNNQELEEKVNSSIEKTISEQSEMEFIDPILEVYKDFQRVPDLSKDEKEFLQKKYSENLIKYKEAKETVRWKLSFPGCGEIKDGDTAGDYIIFHEILKFMKNEKKDVIFLTRDVTKSDWLQKNRKPFIHYIEKVYQLTGQILFIFDATDLLNRISFENIYEVDSSRLEFEDDEEKENYYIERFNNIISVIYKYLQGQTFDGDSVSRVPDRSLKKHDIDFSIQKNNGKVEGVLVYDCGSTKKGFRKSLQRRINACSNLVTDGVVDSVQLFVCLKSKEFDNKFSYDNLHSDVSMKINIGYCEYGDNHVFHNKRIINIL